MKYWPVGSYSVLTHTAKGEGDKDDVELVYIAYKYNVKTTLHFLMAKNAGSTVPDPDNPYIA